MQITSIGIRNFRGIKCVDVEIDNLTILVGSNGIGKTTVLDAIELFFSGSVDRNDFYNHEDEPIVITIGFDEYPEGLKEYLLVDKKITRTFVKNHESIESGYSSMVPKCRDFSNLKELKGNQYKEEYRRLREDGFAELPNPNGIDDMKEAIKAWEQCHIKNCDHKKIDIKVDFTKYIDILPIKAMRDPSIDAGEGGGSTLTKLVNIVIRSSEEEAKKLADMEEALQKAYDEFTDEEKFTGLADMSKGVTGIIRDIEPSMEINFHWSNDTRMPVPRAEAEIMENNFASGITKSGHGAQRLFLYAILRHYHENVVKSQDQHHVLVIDEPEIYQHPVRQEAFYEILKEIKGVQVIYATHSQNFLSVADLPRMRFFGRNRDGVMVKNVSFEHLSKIAKSTDSSSTPKNVERHLRVTDTSDFRKSLFSNAVVLVEGPTDVAIIQSVAKQIKINMPALGISIVPLYSKCDIREQILLYRELEIPTYVIWDLDNINSADDGRVEARNHRIYKFMNIEPPKIFEEAIEENYACFKGTIEDCLIEKIESDIISEFKNNIAELVEVRHFNAKSKYMTSLLIDKIYDEKYSLPKIEKIVRNVEKMT